jgi:bacteriocin-like protein
MSEQKKFRELSDEELASVSGGLSVPGALGGVYLAAQIGWRTGISINSFNQYYSGMSFGEALYYSLR